MTNIKTYKLFLAASPLLVALFSAQAIAASAPMTAVPNITKNIKLDKHIQLSAAQNGVGLASPYSIFAPKRATRSSQIDYQVWDNALSNIVLRLGQSIRVRAKRPDPLVGTRRITGHKSAYRLEGSRVTFSYLNDEYKTGLTEYRKDLERIANKVDITRLARKEQLAFWLNLHNVTLIEQIALNYPVRRPSKLLVGSSKQPLHEAKLLNIRGIALSLRDIRENIVYANWSNPDVMYGFFHGNIGGPALQNFAFTSRNVNEILKLQANDFVNSLRGVHESRNALKVSALYDEAKPYYFPNWETDLKRHLRKHASPDVLEDIASNKPIKLDRYDPVVADLLAGDRPMTANLNVKINGFSQTARMSPEVARLFRELDTKTKIMRQRGMLMKRGTVTIEDIETIDVDIPRSLITRTRLTGLSSQRPYGLVMTR